MKFKLGKEEGVPYDRITKVPLWRVYAVTNFGTVTEGEVGALVSSEQCISQDGLCWADNSCILINSRLSGDAQLINGVSGVNARFSGASHVAFSTVMNSYVGQHARVKGSTLLGGVSVSGNACVNDAWIRGQCLITDDIVIQHQNMFGDQLVLDGLLGRIGGASFIRERQDVIVLPTAEGPLVLTHTRIGSTYVNYQGQTTRVDTSEAFAILNAVNKLRAKFRRST